MTTRFFRQTGIHIAVWVFAMIMIVTAAVALPRAQSQGPESGGASLGTMQGYVCDSSGKPLANATVSLLLLAETGIAAKPAQVAHTDSEGAYCFAAVRAGAYSLRAEMNGYGEVVVGPVSIAARETRKIDLVLAAAKSNDPQNTSRILPTANADAKASEFYDEPQFTVAGVTQATNFGGHGSDTVLRTTEALARATVLLNKETSKESFTSSAAATSAASESSLRDAAIRDPENFDANWRLGKLLVDNGKAAEAVRYLERASRLNPNSNDAELHHLLADVEEKQGNPLEAVREYQRAAELDPKELYLFDWGTELLTHHALEPATAVFTKGNRLFPQSVRMLVALGVAWYARGSYEQAAQYLANASDLDPGNPTPYLFLGRMQSVEITPSKLSLERLGRFVQLQPENPLANYYYAVGLWKQELVASGTDPDNQRDVQQGNDNARSLRVESLLQKAVKIDPKLGAAHLQLGILYAQRGDFTRAISAYQKAIEVISKEVSPQLVNPQLDETLEETHYRLAQAYLRTADKAKAQQQLQLHDQLSKKTKEDAERKRREIQGFMISLRDGNSVSQ